MRCIALSLLFPGVVLAQETRYELGQRLRAFEQAWDSADDAAARKRTLPHLKGATTAFFTLSLGEAARGLDLARLSLAAKKPDAEGAWACSCRVAIGARLRERGNVEAELLKLYAPRDPLPKGARFRLQLLHDGKAVAQAVEADIEELPVKLTLKAKDIPERDYLLRGEIVLAGKTLMRSEQAIAFAEKPKERLDELAKELKEHAANKTCDALTAASLLELLRSLADGKTPETNYPGARLLAEAEALAIRLSHGKPFYGKDRAGQFWLNLPAPRGSSPVRVQVPPQAKAGKPLPLVVALHGAGGSENMFFDGYGNGAIARLCAERGWLLAATRNGIDDGVLGELAKLYPVDTKKIFLVGHSMGAAQAVAAAGAAPEKFAGVAALGGGGRVRASEGLEKVAFYVGVGKEDFALSGSRSLKAALERAKVAKLVYREADDVEHLVIVQLCLPDVFKMFDEVAKKAE